MTARSAMVLTAWGAACVLGASCGQNATQTSQSATAAAAPPAANVDVVEVKLQPLDTVVTLPGELTAYEVASIAAKVNGFVKSVDVDRGSIVRRGEVLMLLDAPELAAAKAEAQAKLEQARAQMLAAQSKLAADDSTFSHLRAASQTAGVVAGNDLVIAENAVAASRAAVTGATENAAAAEEVLKAVTEQEAYLTIQAPFDGVVTERQVHPGDLVGPASGRGNAGLLKIEILTRLRLVVAVPQSDISVVSPGTVVKFKVAEAPGETFSSPIARVAHEVDPKTRTMPVELDVQNAAGRLTPGSFVQVDWPVRRPQPTLFVPATAIASNLERTFVIRIQDGQTEWVDVKLGVTVGALTEVFGPLHERDDVIVRATDAIRPGTKVVPHLVK